MVERRPDCVEPFHFATIFATAFVFPMTEVTHATAQAL